MRILSWLLRALVFFTLFAFALNNQDTVVVHWFFGIDWQAPLVIVVLLAFAAGCTLGVLAMLPPWWRARRQAGEMGPRGPAGAADALAADAARAAPVRPRPATPVPSGFDGQTASRADLGV